MKAAVYHNYGPPEVLQVWQYLDRFGVSAAAVSSGTLPRLIRRVVIGSRQIAIHFDPDAVGAEISQPDDEATHEAADERQILDRLQGRLGIGATVVREHGDLVLTIPIRVKFRGGQNHIVAADGSTGLKLTPRPDRALVKAIVRAHDWLAMLMDGRATSVEGLARSVAQDRGYVRRVLRLAFLSPALTTAIVEGRQPDHVSLTDLLEANIPLAWRDQAQLFEF